MNTTTEKITIKVYSGFKLYDCNRKCKSSPKIGRSWWKQYGYDSPCMCLDDKVILECDDSDEDSDLDICGETGRDFDLKNPVKGCGKTITDDDENIMIGNISFCLECGENGMSDDDDMDINTKMGLMMMAKSVIDERTKCRKK